MMRRIVLRVFTQRLSRTPSRGRGTFRTEFRRGGAAVTSERYRLVTWRKFGRVSERSVKFVRSVPDVYGFFFVVAYRLCEIKSRRVGFNLFFFDLYPTYGDFRPGVMIMFYSYVLPNRVCVMFVDYSTETLSVGRGYSIVTPSGQWSCFRVKFVSSFLDSRIWMSTNLFISERIIWRRRRENLW